MAKMSELAAEIAELKHCGVVLISISETLTELFSGTGAETEEPKPQEKETKKQLTLEEVRAVMAEKSRSGHTTEVKEIITSFGANKLSEISPDKYEELLQKVEVL